MAECGALNVKPVGIRVTKPHLSALYTFECGFTLGKEKKQVVLGKPSKKLRMLFQREFEQTLAIECWAVYKEQRVFIGDCEIPIDKVVSDIVWKDWVTLMNRGDPTGHIHLSMSFSPYAPLLRFHTVPLSSYYYSPGTFPFPKYDTI